MSSKSRWRNRAALGAMMGLVLACPASAQATNDVLAEAPLTYIVRAGDNLYTLARNYLNRPADYRELQRKNRVANPRRMPTGRSLDIPVQLLRTRPDSALLESYRGQVQVLRDATPQMLVRGLTLSEGDVVSTGNNSFARIALSDGSYAVVPSNSRIRLDRLRRFEINNEPDHHLSVQSGRLQNSVNPRQRPGTYRVTTPSAVSAVRGTEFRVTYNEAIEAGSLGVLEGTVATAALAGGDAALNTAGQGSLTVRGAEGVLTAALLAAPALVSPEKIQTGAVISFDTLPAPETALVRGVIGNDTGMTDPVAEIESTSPQLTLDTLDEGRWFIRLTGTSAQGLEGRPRTYDFIRARNGVEGLALAEGLEDGFRTYRFGWRGVGQGEASFRFQLWQVDADGNRVGPYLIDKPALLESNYTLTDLPKGDYQWRVESVRHRFGHRLSAWSEPEQLTISR